MLPHSLAGPPLRLEDDSRRNAFVRSGKRRRLDALLARPLSLTSRGAHLHTQATQTATTAAATELDAMSSLVTRPNGSHGARARDRRRARSMHARRNLMVHLTGGRRLVEAEPPREARSSPPHSLRSGCSLLRCREHESYCCVQLQIVQNHREIIKSQRKL